VGVQGKLSFFKKAGDVVGVSARHETNALDAACHVRLGGAHALIFFAAGLLVFVLFDQFPGSKKVRQMVERMKTAKDFVKYDRWHSFAYVQ